MQNNNRNHYRRKQKPQEKYIPNYQKLNISPTNMPKQEPEQQKYLYEIEEDNVNFDQYDENDEPIYQSGEMIDNNEYVFIERSEGKENNTQPIHRQQIVQNIQKVERKNNVNEKNEFLFSNIDVNIYVLIIREQPIFSGTLEQIEEQTRLILYKENPHFKDKNIRTEEIVILKRVPVNVGVFVDR